MERAKRVLGSNNALLIAAAVLFVALFAAAASAGDPYPGLPLGGVQSNSTWDDVVIGRGDPPCCNHCSCYEADINSCRCRDRREDGCFAGCKKCMCARTWQQQCICYDATDSCQKLNPCGAVEDH